MKLIIGLLVLSFLAVSLLGCNLDPGMPVDNLDKYCVNSDDCACGSHISTGACFYGNRDYVNTLKQCPDFYTGFGGNLEIRCLDNKCTAFAEPVVEPPIEGFCGTSTLGACSMDSDCVKGGCSGQVCQSKDEEQLATTCEYRDCYNDKDYGLECKCESDKCKWTQTLFVD